MSKDNRQVTDKRHLNLKTDAGPGRPKGQRNFATIYREAIEKIAKSKDITADEFEIQLVEQAIRKGFNGDTRFYTDTLDRIHGKAQQAVDLTTGGEPLRVIFDNSFNKDDSPR